jgi:hypothetical protein
MMWGVSDDISTITERKRERGCLDEERLPVNIAHVTGTE